MHHNIREKSVCPCHPRCIPVTCGVRSYTPACILESGLLPPSIAVCKSVKYAKSKTNKWVFYTESSIPLQTLHHSYSCIPGLHPHLEYATPVLDPHQQWLINSVERVQKFALKVCTKSWSSGYESMLQSCNLPTLASTRHYLHETMPTLSNCQCLSKFPYTVPIVATTKHVQISATTIALERPVTCHHCHFSHIKLPCGRAYLHMYNLPVIHSLKQTVICHTFNTPPYT